MNLNHSALMPVLLTSELFLYFPNLASRESL